MNFAPDNWWFRGRSFGLSVCFREVDEKSTYWFTDWSETISSNISIWSYSLVWTIYFSRWKRYNPNWFWGDDASSDHRLKADIGGSLGITGITMNPLFSLDSAKFFATKFRGAHPYVSKILDQWKPTTNQNTRRVATLLVGGFNPSEKY